MADIKPVGERLNHHAIQLLTDALEQAKNGDLTGVTIINEFKGGTYAVTGSSSLSRLQTAGALLEAAVLRLEIGQ